MEYKDPGRYSYYVPTIFLGLGFPVESRLKVSKVPKASQQCSELCDQMSYSLNS